MGWYYVITQEMREMLDGKEVDVFAVINGFSQLGQGCFHGSLSELSKYCGIKSKVTTQNILKSLVERGFIIKEEEFRKGVKFCYYSVNMNCYGISKIDMGMSKIDTGGISKIDTGISMDDMGGISKIDTNNKDIYINNNKLSINKDRHRFQKPSIEEIRQYCAEKSLSIDAEQFYNFYESKGWKVGKSPMVSWRAAVATWVRRREVDVRRQFEPPKRRESVLEHNLKVADEIFGTNLHKQTYSKGGDHGQ